MGWGKLEIFLPAIWFFWLDGILLGWGALGLFANISALPLISLCCAVYQLGEYDSNTCESEVR
jgi:hypothetical protein